MKALTTLIAALALSGCMTYRHAEDGLSRARFGETVRVGTARVTPLTLIEDSRCPQGVQCLWAGRVRITARVASDGGTSTRELTLGEAAPVALVEVLPAKRQEAVPSKAYRFAFRAES